MIRKGVWLENVCGRVGRGIAVRQFETLLISPDVKTAHNIKFSPLLRVSSFYLFILVFKRNLSRTSLDLSGSWFASSFLVGK